jgi:hypothetical protein
MADTNPPTDATVLKELLITSGKDGGRVYPDLQRAIARMGDEALPVLTWAISEMDIGWGIRRAAAIGLGMLDKTDEIVALLSNALNDPSNAVSQAARRQLQHLGESLVLTPAHILERIAQHNATHPR